METQTINNYRKINVNIVSQQWSPVVTINSMPAKTILGTAKKAYSEVFSTSKRTGKNLWELLTPILPDPANKESRQSLDIAIYQWLLTAPLQNTLPVNNVPFITGFQFNEEFTLEEMEKAAFTVIRNPDNTLEITTPEFNPAKDICAPLNTESFSFKIMAVSCDVVEGMKTGGYISELNIPYNDEQIKSQNIHLPLNAKQGDLILIALAVEYTILIDDSSKVVHDQRWMPAGIIWAGYN